MIQPSHSYTLAKCWPIHLISIEFQNIDNGQGSLREKLFLSLQVLYLAIHEVTLTKILYTISIARYKILRLEVEKYHLILNIDPHVNKYMFQAQYSAK